MLSRSPLNPDGRSGRQYSARADCVTSPTRPALRKGILLPLWTQRERNDGVRQSDFDEALADSVEDGLGAIIDLELLVHIAHVVANRLLADLELVGDLLVRHAAGQHLEDLDLAHREPAVELLGGSGPGQYLEHPACHRAR